LSKRGLVSIIIPAYNATTYLRQTLNSVLGQTYQAIEVIVVDDGSSDATSAVVEQFATLDARVRLIRQSNAGVGVARNTGIAKARGEYIAPLDADDWWFPEKLAKQVACMEQAGGETGLVYCWFALIDEQDNFVTECYPWTVEGRVRHALVLRNFVGNASVPLLRKTALDKVGLYLTRAEQGGAQGCEDWDLSLRIAEHFNVRFVPEYLVAYRQTNCSMSSGAEGMIASFAVAMRRARERNPDLPADAFRWSASYFYSFLAGTCHFWGDDAGCFRCWKRAISANPIVLLDLWFYKQIMDGALGRIADSIRPSATDSRPKGKKKLRLITNAITHRMNVIFTHIECARWLTAMHDGT
jgi:glycosyltransferase involved in cell wall biosynthesis